MNALVKHGIPALPPFTAPGPACMFLPMQNSDSSNKSGLVALCVIFFCSGFPALIYQLVWQRSLFAIYGINVESVTVVVSAFMLGLGLGSLAGGALSRIRRLPLLPAFGVIELAIGVFGYFSLDLFHAVGEATLGAGLVATGLLTFALVLLPTVLMGATLPILVTHLVASTRNVGRSVGLLYFVNTLGSAAACFAVALVLMRALGMRGAVQFACLLNVCVAASAFLVAPRKRAKAEAPVAAASLNAPTFPQRRARFWLAAVLVGVTGYISLSYEILWFRVHSLATGGHAMAFASLLGAFLLGIALGSLFARRFCDTEPTDRHLRALVLFVLAANLAGFLVAPVSGWLLTVLPYPFLLPVVAVAAGLLGATFPLICHFGVTPDERAGSGLSYLYLSNIIGSGAGSLLTGFVLMQHLGTGQITLLLALLGTATAALLAVAARQPGRLPAKALALAGGAAVLVLALYGPLFSRLYENLLLPHRQGTAQDRDPRSEFASVVESRSGVINVTQDGVVYGGGMYDGVFSVDLVDDRNMIARPFSVSAFHPRPARVLMIGLASGSWAQVMAYHPHLEHMTVVEISPGYLELIRQHEEVAGLPHNPKVEIVIDDGRRWLNRNPDERFDAIVMNTTWHWRAHITNLLSVEFLQLMRKHLKPGGVALYNTTDSPEVQRTACTVFPHVVRVINSVVVSDSPLLPDRARWEQVLLDYRIEAHPVLDPSQPRHAEKLAKLLGMIDSLADANPPWWGMETRSSILARTEGMGIVTDDNMGTEWRINWPKK